MSPTPTTPGQLAYGAFYQTFGDRHAPLPWDQLGAPFQAAWEAAAFAVLGWAQAQQPGTAGWLKAHPPPPCGEDVRRALEATLEAFGEDTR